MNKVPVWGMLYRNGKGVGTEIGEIAILREGGVDVQCKSGGWAIQTNRPKYPWYFETLPDLTSPLSSIMDNARAEKWLGAEVRMWPNGYHPDKAHSLEGVLTEFNARNLYNSHTNRWRMTVTTPGGDSGNRLHCQAHEPFKRWFILPESIFGELNTAGMLNRIFLGR